MRHLVGLYCLVSQDITIITPTQRGRITSFGIPFDDWTEHAGLHITNGAVFWMQPTLAPTFRSGRSNVPTDVVVAQVTVVTGEGATAVLGAQGTTDATDEHGIRASHRSRIDARVLGEKKKVSGRTRPERIVGAPNGPGQKVVPF